MSFAFASGVVLQHTKLLHHRKINELVGPNLAAVRHEIEIEGLYNPAMASYIFASAGGQQAFGPVFTPGIRAPVTEASVQWALQQPRKPFAFVAGGVLVVFGPKPISVRGVQFAPSPPGGNAPGLGPILNLVGIDLTPVIKQKYGFVDCKNGPLCAADVVENIGDKTFTVRWRITTWINDAPAPNAPLLRRAGVPNPAQVQYPTPPLLANEYEVAEHVDPDFFTTRFVRGRAVFRSDVLKALQLFPDQLRYWLGLPVPPRFRREQIQVRQLSDGLTLEYQYADRERVLNFDPNVFTRVEMTASTDTEKLGLESVLKSALVSTFDRFANALGSGGGSASGSLAAMAGRAIVRAVGGVVAPAIVFGLAVLATGLPVTSYRVVGRFWGHAQQNRQYLETMAFQTFDRLTELYFGAPLTIRGLSIPAAVNIGPMRIPIPPPLGGLRLQFADLRLRSTADLSGMFLEIEGIWTGSRLQELLGQFIPRIFRGGAAAPPAAPRQVRAIYIDPMRGTYLGAAVASALRDSSDLWTLPALPPEVWDVEADRSVTFVAGPAASLPGSSLTGDPATPAAGITLP